MSFLTCSLVALPLLAFCFVMMFRMQRRGKKAAGTAFKCGGTLVILLLAALGLRGYLIRIPTPAATPQYPGPVSLRGALPYLAFFLLCLIADGLLEYAFLPGMLAFASAHICLIWWLSGTPAMSWRPVLAIGAAVFLVTLLLFRKELPKQGKLIPALVFYALLLSCVLGLSLSISLRGSKTALLLAAGALCFYLSDLIVAKLNFSGWAKKWEKPCMILYWLALYLLSGLYWLRV